MKKQAPPTGWDDSRIQEVAHHYEAQPDDEAVTEVETAMTREGWELMCIPRELVAAVEELVADHERAKSAWRG